MAQTGYTPISIYYSATATNTPTAGNLVAGELAINTNDGVLYYKDSSGVVQSIASKAGNSGSFTNLAYTGTLTGGTGVVNLGSGQFYKDASGNVGIGTSSPLAKLQVNGAIRTTYDSNYYGTFNNATGAVQVYANGDSAPLLFGTTSNGGSTATERMRIDASGNVNINRTTPIGAGKLNLNFAGNVGQGLAINDTTSSNGAQFEAFYYGSGTFLGSISNVSNTAVAYNTTSDYRLKTVIGAVTNSGERIDALEPIEYDWNAGGRTRGFLAHQFAEVYPNSVTGEKDAVDADGKPVYQAMQASTSEVMADLIAEIQSLRKRVAQLESK